MAIVTYGMMMSLDGFIGRADGNIDLPVPDSSLHQHFNDATKRASAMVFGRKMYQIMQYWDTADQNPDSSEVELEFTRVWQKLPKVVVSDALTEVGPNARIVPRDGLADAVRRLKAEASGTIEVGGATLAGALSQLGLIDEYRLYFHPRVMGNGVPYFARDIPLELKLLGVETLTQEVVMLRYGPAEHTA